MSLSSYSLPKNNLSQQQFLVRMDLNVPLDGGGHVTNDNRIRAAIPTLQHILSREGSCIVMSHLGRPHGKINPRYSLQHIIPSLQALLGRTVQFADYCVGEETQAKASALKPGEVLLLENLRFHKEEEGGCPTFAEKLARLGNTYVNDAFGVAHRKHASVAIVPRFFKKKYFGVTLSSELAYARLLLNRGERPFVAIVGGAKISDKITLLDRLLEKVDRLIIGGGMAYTFCRALGGDVGQSLVEEDKLNVAKKLVEKARKKGVAFLLPEDSVISSRLDAKAQVALADSFHITPGWMGLDIGPKAQQAFSKALSDARSILWNGPMGVFEMKNFEAGTRSIGEAVARATEQGAFSLVGGGDSIAAATKFGLQKRISHYSTGGGALLAYFEGTPLPAIEAFTLPLLP